MTWRVEDSTTLYLVGTYCIVVRQLRSDGMYVTVTHVQKYICIPSETKQGPQNELGH